MLPVADDNATRPGEFLSVLLSIYFLCIGYLLPETLHGQWMQFPYQVYHHQSKGLSWVEAVLLSIGTVGNSTTTGCTTAIITKLGTASSATEVCITP